MILRSITERVKSQNWFAVGIDFVIVVIGVVIGIQIESFNGRLRDECLNVNEFGTLDEARLRLQSWRQDYNHHRPHGSLGRLTPSEFASKGQESDPEVLNL